MLVAKRLAGACRAGPTRLSSYSAVTVAGADLARVDPWSLREIPAPGGSRNDETALETTAEFHLILTS